MAPFWIGFNYLKAAEPLRRESFLLTTNSRGFPGIYLIDLLSWPLNHLVALELVPVGSESSVSNTKLQLHKPLSSLVP